MSIALILLTALGAPAPSDSKGDTGEVRKLMEARVAVLQRYFARQEKLLKDGVSNPMAVAEAGRELGNAELDLSPTPEKRRLILLFLFKQEVAVDEYLVGLLEAGMLDEVAFLQGRARRLKAEADLRRAGGTPPKDIKPARDPKPPKGE